MSEWSRYETGALELRAFWFEKMNRAKARGSDELAEYYYEKLVRQNPSPGYPTLWTEVDDVTPYTQIKRALEKYENS